MTLHTFPDLIQGTDEWLQARRGILTASTVGKLITSRPPAAVEFDCPECGATPDSPCLSKARKGEPVPIKTIHPARTETAANSGLPPVLTVADTDYTKSVVAGLVAERITGHVEETRMTADMWRGVEDEPRAREFYNEHHAPVKEIGFMTRDDWGFTLGYSPDGLVGDDGLIEIKSRLQKTQLLTVLNDEVPAENMAQLQAGLLVSGRAWIDYVAFCGGMPLYVKRVEPDPRWATAILAAAEHFEATAADLLGRYKTVTEGMPLTERAPSFTEMVV